MKRCRHLLCVLVIVLLGWADSQDAHAQRPDGSWGRPSALAWSPNSKSLAVVYPTGKVEVLDVETNQRTVLLQRADVDYDVVVAWSPDGSRLAVKGRYDYVVVLRVSDGYEILALNEPPYISAIAWSPDGSKLAAVSYEYPNSIRVFDASTGQLLNAASPGRYLCSVAWSPDGKKLAIGRQYRVQIWDSSNLQLLKTISDNAQEEVSIAWSSDGAKIASANLDYRVRIWNTRTGQLIHTLTGHRHFVNSVAWSKDDTRIASGSSDGTVRIWDAASGETLQIIQAGKPVYSAAWSPDGSRFAYGTLDGTVKIIRGPMTIAPTVTDAP